MHSHNPPNTEIILSFRSVTELAKFKNECGCRDFYIDRDALTLVGTFSEEQIRLATTKYAAMYQSEPEIKSSHG